MREDGKRARAYLSLVLGPGRRGSPRRRWPWGPANRSVRRAKRRALFKVTLKRGMGSRSIVLIPSFKEFPQPPSASKPLPHIDPKLMAACQARKPSLGQP